MTQGEQGPKGDRGERGEPGRALLPALLVVILIALTITLVSGVILVASQLDTNKVLTKQGEEFKASQLAECHRGNDSRQAILKFMVTVQHGNQARASAWGALLKTPSLTPNIIDFAQQQVAANSFEAARIHHLAVAVAASQSSVAKDPSASLLKRSVVDCAGAFK